MRKVSKSGLLKSLAVFLALNLLTQILFPTISWALTGGPSQPEMKAFTPASASDMVDLFTGDFSYNIPLMDAGGYPINLNYSAGITPDQEASWVGLGWNINVGSINRTVRGLPDDFKGDAVKTQINKLDDITVGVGTNADLEMMGYSTTENGRFVNLGVGMGISYNNYNGLSYDMSLNPSVSLSIRNSTKLSGGVEFKGNSEEGVTITPQTSFSGVIEDDIEKDINGISLGGKVGMPFNTREGLKSLTFGSDIGVAGKGGFNLADRTFNYHFASPTYVPTMPFESHTFTSSFTCKAGVSFFTLFGNADFYGNIAVNSIDNDEKLGSAYGYLYAQKAELGGSKNKLLDFNREKDGSYTEHTPNIALAQHTYDIYSVTGQGVGGTYRPARSDIGTVYDAFSISGSSGFDIGGIELGGGNLTQTGVNVAINAVNSSSGKWNDAKNTVKDQLEFQSGTGLYEPSYFKALNELNVESDKEFFNAMGGFEPVKIKLSEVGSQQKALPYYDYKSSGVSKEVLNTTRSQRARRNQTIQYKTVDEAQKVALETSPEYYEFLDVKNPSAGVKSIPFKRQNHPKHHISEIAVTRDDGARYIYGIPAYNNLQKEVTFAIDSKNYPDCRSGLVSFINGQDNDADNNDNGADNYFQKTELPSYAHSFLLTSIVSSDYVDRTGNGPTDDDMGAYTKFRYVKIPGCKWRTPFTGANYNEGLLATDDDNKASYVYGEKDIWYLYSIETPTHITIFSLENRNDAYGVSGEAGGSIDTERPLKKLSKISLYSKGEYQKYKEKAQAIKVVHFDYDYSLCPGYDNGSLFNNKSDVDQNVYSVNGNTARYGKLTLKRVYFTYGNSYKGKLSPYEFNYESKNPGYDIKSYDRWGNYKQNPKINSTLNLSDRDVCRSVLSNEEFPYVNQNKAQADDDMSVWSLTSIKLPSGGLIKVEYEADDYAFVQNRRAMQMTTIVSSAPSDYTPETAPVPSSNSHLYSNNKDYRILYFKLNSPIASDVPNGAKENIGKLYFEELDGTPMKFLYFKFLASMTEGRTEYIPGYSEIESYGVAPAESDGGKSIHKYGWVKLKPAKIGGDNVNPVSLSTVQFARIYTPVQAFQDDWGPDRNDINIEKIISKYWDMITAISNVSKNANEELFDKGIGQSFIPHKSFIRLYQPEYKKFGGGLRVKRLLISDEWKAMVGVTTQYKNHEYGQEYSYTMEDHGKVMSSGVASYEPLLGGDENPFREPDLYEVDKTWAPSDRYYQEKPYGETMFPSSIVGYSRVTVKNIKPQNVTINCQGTGKVVHEFYTARDFPTITSKTDPTKIVKKPSFGIGLMVSAVSSMHASQGYVIELNDMHGKPKAQRVYPEGKNDPISEVQYIYKTQQQPGKILQLSNEVDVVGKDGVVKKDTMGIDYDVVVDSRKSETEATTLRANININSFWAFIAPVILGAVYPGTQQSKNTFKSLSVTKVIKRSGILQKVITRDLGSETVAENLIYDQETGQVLLSKTTDEFDKPVYSFTYPAHWAYEGMEQAYQNMDYITKGQLSSLSKDYFVPGDELAIKAPGKGWEKVWVTDVSDGVKISYSYIPNSTSLEGINFDEIKIIRSGHKNMQALSMGSIICLENPVITRDGINILQFALPNKEWTTEFRSSIVEASAVNYKDEWPILCDCDNVDWSKYNDYYTGKRGNWRLNANYLYQTKRKQSLVNNNTDIRNDGTYELFNPFWRYEGNKWWDRLVIDHRWSFTNQVTLYNPHGKELENHNALNQFTGATYGFLGLLPTSVASNARYQEIGYDSFEDYSKTDCMTGHFNFLEYRIPYAPVPTDDLENPTRKEAHTGKHSLQISAGKEITITKRLEECEIPKEPVQTVK